MTSSVSLPPSGAAAHPDAPRAIRSHRVRKLVKLERQARRQMDRAAHALASAERSLGRALILRRRARALEVTLTGSQLGELLRLRSQTPRATPPMTLPRADAGAGSRVPEAPARAGDDRSRD